MFTVLQTSTTVALRWIVAAAMVYFAVEAVAAIHLLVDAVDLLLAR